MKTCETKLYTYDELNESAKEKALAWASDINIDHDWWDGDGLLDIEQSKWYRWGLKNCLFTYDKFYFDLDPNYSHLEFVNLKVTDREIFRKALGLSKKLWAKCYTSFGAENSSYRGKDTVLFIELNDPEDHFTTKELEQIKEAQATFSEWVVKALQDLTRQYEYLQSREAIEETIQANEYYFTEEGIRHD